MSTKGNTTILRGSNHIFHQKLILKRQFRYSFIKEYMSKGDKGGQWNWVQHGTCYVGSSPGLTHSSLIASFDMDDTLITRKSGAKWPKDAHDWLLLYDNIKATVKKISE